MATPLSALSDAEQNLRSPRKMQTPSLQQVSYKSSTSESHEYTQSENYYSVREDSPPSSPFMADVDLTSQSFARPQTPSRPSSPQKSAAETPTLVPLTEQSLRHNDRLDRESKDTVDRPSEGSGNEDAKGFNPDDTCFSAFSAIPNVDMTAFARLTSSPTRSERGRDGRMTPPSSGPTPCGGPTTPSTIMHRRPYQSPSPTPRGKANAPEDATTQLLEFTEQLNLGPLNAHSPTRGIRLSPNRPKSQPDLLAGSAQRLRSPRKNSDRPLTPSESRYLTNLLDFDLPPAPTPRSVPSITARELESLKAGFLSEISSLKARLSGQEAEIKSLKEAKDDAETRVGTASEELREIRNARAVFEGEKEDLEKRDREMQSILREVKEELLHGERERKELSEKISDLSTKLEDRERRLEDSEARVSEAESKLAGFAQSQNVSEADVQNPVTPSNKAVEVAVDKVARELHALYKTKHETKVSALKKSYEARWEKRVKELQSKVDDLQRENEDLKVGRDATMSGVVPAMNHAEVENPGTGAAPSDNAAELQLLTEEKTATSRKLEELGARLEGFEAEVAQLRRDNGTLLQDLDTSRRENGELVAAVEQMLLLETSSPPVPSIPQHANEAPSKLEPQHTSTTAATATTTPRLPHSSSFSSTTSSHTAGSDAPRTGAASKISGLRGPGFGSSLAKRSTSENSAAGSRSGIMSNIERMGRGRVVAE